MTVLAHAGGADEIVYVFLPGLIFFLVYRLVRGRPGPPEPPERDDADADPATPTSPR